MPTSIISRNRNYLGLLAANTILGSAMPMLIILGGLAGLLLAPSIALATLPASLQTLAGLLAAAPFSLLMGKLGRKTGFVTGVAVAIVGALIGVWALFAGSFILLCIAHLALGAALACYQYFRFAAAETVSTAACRDFIDAYVGTDCSLRRATNVYCRERCLRASSSGRRLCSACGLLAHWPDPVGIDQTTQPIKNYAAEP